MEKSLVMLIDDDPLSISLYAEIIKKRGPAVQVIAMTSAWEAIKYLKNDQNKKPGFIILDLMMPVMNGWDFINEYRKLNLTIEMVVLTSSKKLEDKVRAERHSEIKGFHTKPLSLDNILNLIFK